MNYSQKKISEIFSQSQDCDCGSQDCDTNHRACYLCGEKIQWNEYVGNSNSNSNSKCLWDVDHIRPKSILSNNDISNLVAVHPWCNKNKGNR